MANTPWNNWTLCTVKDITDRYLDANVPLRFSPSTDKNSKLEEIIENKIALAKQIIKQDLWRDLKKVVIDTCDQWLAFKRFQISNIIQTIDKDILQIGEISGVGGGIGSLIATGAVFELLWMVFTGALNMHPSTWTNYGAPPTGKTLNYPGGVLPGDIMLDSQFYVLYINTSLDLNYTNWVVLSSDNAIDNILNAGYQTIGGTNFPGVLWEPSVFLTLSLMFEDGSGRDRTGFDSVGPYYITRQENYYEKYKESYQKNFSLLQINISETGQINNFEKTLNTPQQWYVR